ncbi:MAG: carboxymuconolactone decarboxylase family protein [Candidatus Marinimicrobia bacterium]|nr:carboxymuconolactone decarboxylase family protein [Candidatus Neomarinimicrobiota bacterium]
MSRLKAIDVSEAQGEIKELYEAIEQEMGKVPNIFKGMAVGPVLLKAYLQLDELIAAGTLSGAEQDIVRLVVSQFNGCNYCLAAHTKTAAAQGLSGEEILAARRGRPQDEKQAALVAFVRRILDTKGFVEAADIEAFRDAGYTDAQVCEVITIIGQKMMSNYFNHVNATELDFPEAETL